jgi:hypothetical protein
MLILRAKVLSDAGGTAHGFFGRTGGVSEGIYASLNCGPGSKDAPAHVTENRRRALAALGGTRLVTLYQVHSASAVTVTEPWDIPDNPKADAMATGRPGIALGILAADCAPVLLADPEARVVGAAHAGWNGALAGVVESAVKAMLRLGARPERIRAAIGPCISKEAYEVGPEFEARFRAADAANTRFFIPSPRAGHWQFDLESYVAQRLARAGVSTVERLSACTYAREADFFSYRRATHRREADYGRQLSAIMLSQ